MRKQFKLLNEKKQLNSLYRAKFRLKFAFLDND